ncbi:MAG: NTP transferase domain-containing protein [Bacteroidales bacterium]|nr:NTP transferase domain-containing protein [Bacteroidales bacterium]
MKAMILAAGLGTRLQPLTDSKPKALLEINGVSLLEMAIRRVAGAGIRDIVINVHHFAGQVIDFLNKADSFGLNIMISDESDLLLDTGGALKKAAHFFNGEEDFLIHNVDVLTDLNINELIIDHQRSGARATLAVRERPTSRNLLIDQSGQLCGWEYPEKHLRVLNRDSIRGLRPVAFSCIYLLSTKLFEKMPEDQVFGLMPWLLSLCGQEGIRTWEHPAGFWYEAGRPESLAQAEKKLFFDPDSPVYIFEKRV